MLFRSNTTGYSAEHLLFNTYMTKDIDQKKPNKVAFAYDISSYHSFENGAMKITGNSLDLAIKGTGFFAVETPLGTRYTRAGNFQIDPSGALITSDGKPVLGDVGQRITIPPDARDITIGSAGNISVDGEEIAKLGIYKFENPQLLEKTDGASFKSAADPLVADDAVVAQGVLEDSNVKPVIELTHLIDVSRSVSTTAKFVEVMYDLQRKTASTYAQQNA